MVVYGVFIAAFAVILAVRICYIVARGKANTVPFSTAFDICAFLVDSFMNPLNRLLGIVGTLVVVWRAHAEVILFTGLRFGKTRTGLRAQSNTQYLV